MSKQSNPKDGKAELDQAWTVAYEQAEKKFGELTKKYLKDFKDKDGKTLLRRDMKVDTLVTQVNGGRELAAAKRADHQNWTRVLKKVVVPIETLGGLAAGIAAVVRKFLKLLSYPIENQLLAKFPSIRSGGGHLEFLTCVAC